MLRAPFLPGDSDINQLNLIFRRMGTPTGQCWPVGCVLKLVVHLITDLLPNRISDVSAKQEYEVSAGVL